MGRGRNEFGLCRDQLTFKYLRPANLGGQLALRADKLGVGLLQCLAGRILLVTPLAGNRTQLVAKVLKLLPHPVDFAVRSIFDRTDVRGLGITLLSCGLAFGPEMFGQAGALAIERLEPLGQPIALEGNVAQLRL
jgi:hypothetical protein